MIYKRDEGVSFLTLGCWYQDIRQFNLYSLNPNIPFEITFLTMTIIRRFEQKYIKIFLFRSFKIKIYESILIQIILSQCCINVPGLKRKDK